MTCTKCKHESLKKNGYSGRTKKAQLVGQNAPSPPRPQKQRAQPKAGESQSSREPLGCVVQLRQSQHGDQDDARHGERNYDFDLVNARVVGCIGRLPVAYHSLQDAEVRLANPGSLTEQEILDMLPWMRIMSGNSLQRLNAEVAFMSVKATRQFDASSSRLAKWMMGLVALQVILGAVQVVLIVCRH